MNVADNVGEGIRKVKVTKPAKFKATYETTPLSEAASMVDEDWVDKPEAAGMHSDPSAYRLANQEVIILDLAKDNDLKRYNDLITRNSSAKADLLILEEEKKFTEETGNWKIFIKVQYLQFRKLLKKGKKPDSILHQEAELQNVL